MQKSYLISYKFVKKSHPGIILEGVLGLKGELKFETHPSHAEVMGLIGGSQRVKMEDYVLVGLSITTLPADWLTKTVVTA